MSNLGKAGSVADVLTLAVPNQDADRKTLQAQREDIHFLHTERTGVKKPEPPRILLSSPPGSEGLG